MNELYLYYDAPKKLITIHTCFSIFFHFSSIFSFVVFFFLIVQIYKLSSYFIRKHLKQHLLSPVLRSTAIKPAGTEEIVYHLWAKENN